MSQLRLWFAVVLLFCLGFSAQPAFGQSCPVALNAPEECSQCTGAFAFCQNVTPGIKGPDDAQAINTCLNEPTCKCARLTRDVFQVRSPIFADGAPNRGRNLDGGRLFGRGPGSVLKVVGNGSQCTFPTSDETVTLPNGTTIRKTYMPVVEVSRASQFTLDGFKIDLTDRLHRCSSQTFVFGGYAVLVKQASAKARISNLEIVGTPFVNTSSGSGGVNTGGIYVIGGSETVVQGNRLSDIGYQLDADTGSSGVSGIQVNNSARSCVALNTVSRVAFGIEVANFFPGAASANSGNSSGTIVRQNTIVGAGGIKDCDGCSQGRAIKLQACRSMSGTINGVSCPPTGPSTDPDPPPLRDLVVEENTASQFGGRNTSDGLRVNGSGLDLICGVQFSRFAGNSIDGRQSAAEFGLQVRSSFEPCNPYRDVTNTHHNTFVNNTFFSGASGSGCGSNCRDVNFNADAPDQINIGRNRDTPIANNNYRGPIRHDGGANLCPGSDASTIQFSQKTVKKGIRLQFSTVGVRPNSRVLVSFRRTDGFAKTFEFTNVECRTDAAKLAGKIGLEPGTYEVTANYQDGNAQVGNGPTPVNILGDRLGMLTLGAGTQPPQVAGELTVAPASVNLTTGVGGTASQTLAIGSTGGSLDWSASEGVSWLSLSPQEGVTPGSLRADASAAGLAAGVYQTSILISALDAADVVVPVTLTVSSAALPNLTVSPSGLNFTATVGGGNPQPQTFTVGSTGSQLTASVASSVSWLSLSPTSGSTPATFSASVNITGLPAGTYTGTLTITAPGAGNSPLSLPVSLTVSTAASGALTVTPATLSFSRPFGEPSSAEASLRVESLPPGLMFSASDDASWLSLSPANGTTNTTVSVSANAFGLPVGMYTGMIRLEAGTAANAAVMVPVSLTVTPPVASAVLSATPASLAFSFTKGGANPTPKSLRIDSSGDPLTFQIAEDAPWLFVSPGIGTTGESVSVGVNPTGLAAGTYNTMLTVSAVGASNSPLSVPVMLTVTDAPTGPSLNVSAVVLSYSVTIGQATTAEQVFTVASSQGPLGFSVASNAPWLTTSPSSGTTSAQVTARVDATGFSAGSYNAQLTVAAPGALNSPVNVAVVLNVNAPGATLGVFPSSLMFNAAQGANNPPAQDLAISGATGSQFAATSNASWLSVVPASGFVPGAASVAVETTGLAAGTYNGIVTVSSLGLSPRQVPVTLTVTPPVLALAVAPRQLVFNAPAGFATPVSQPLSITSTGTRLTWTASSDSPWLSVSPASGQTPTTTTVSVTASQLTPGIYRGSVTVSASGVASVRVPVELAVGNVATSLTVAPQLLVFTAQRGVFPSTQSFRVETPLSGGVAFTISTPTPWLQVGGGGVTPANGLANLTDAGVALAPGRYEGVIFVQAADGTTAVAVPVSLTVTLTAPPTRR